MLSEKPTVRLCCALLGAIVLAQPRAEADVERQRNPESGQLSWQFREPGFSLRFIQLLPDYVRAVYGARGLPPELVETMAGYCVFGTIIKNESDRRLTYRVADWRYVTPDGRRHPVKTKSEWLQEWQDQGVSFRWSILPDAQTFEPGDWSQGFTTIALAPASRFNLEFSWRLDGETHHAIIEDMRCAPAQAPQQD
ncbi:MAG TPA: hypothetical protein ENK05_00110 [Gammaproteobacteria bacterium]|nr:hypothetical protein [Gammaproteobacteria bacterium]